MPVQYRSLSLPVLSITCLLVFSASGLAQSPPITAVPARIATSIDESSRVTLRGNVHPLVRVSTDNGPAPISMPASRMLLVLSRSMQQEAELQTFLQSLQDQNSPNYRKFLSPDEFGKRFGVGDADLHSVQAWLTSQGFAVNQVHPGRMVIEFSGTVGQVQNAFHTSVHAYTNNGQHFWASATDPQIPGALASVVAGVASLNSIKPRAHNVRGPGARYDPVSHTIKPAYTLGNASNGYIIFLGPADVATIYDTPTTLNPNRSGTLYDGTGVTIGIAGDSNIDLTQNAKYRATFSLAAKATNVVVDGADPGENGDAVEAYLDTQVSGGVAPNANVILYTAQDTTYQSGLVLAIARALDDNQADILNVSFGYCEAGLGAAGNQLLNTLWQQAAAQGISVTVSTGDSGSAGCDNPNTETIAVNGLAVSGFSSTPYNIAVGGTDYDTLYSSFPGSFTSYVDVSNTLPNHRSALRYIPEEPWNDSTFPNTSILQNIPFSAPDNIVGGGGGISTVYPAPGWQSGFGSSSGRSVPDVSFLAGDGFYGAGWGICTDFDTDRSGNPVTDCAAGATGNSFNLTGIGGTSASAPAFAGMLALLKQKTGARLGQAGYALYQLAKTNYSTVFHDVTTGDNSVFCASGTPNCQPVTAINTNYLSGYNAGVGYDEATGLGSVDSSQMITKWSSASFTSTTSSLKLNGAASALNVTHGQSVSVTDAVSGSGGTPSGSVALVDNLTPATQPNSESIASFPLTGGTASGATTYFPGGTYQVSAHYGGDSTFAQSDSNAIQVTVAPETSTTTLKVTGIYDPTTGKAVTTSPTYGLIYLLDAQPYGNSASANNPNGAATGSVTFKSGSTTLGSNSLSSAGVAELITTTIPGGNNSLTAVFPGDPSFQASTSAPLALNVTPAVTVIGMPTAQQAPTPGNYFSLNVTLSANSAGAAPTGTVTFMNGSTTLGSVQLSGTAASGATLASGTATFTTSNLPGGNYTISAVYSGDNNYAASTSPALALYVYKAGAVINVTPSATTIVVNQPLQVTVSPAPLNGFPIPTGTVTLSYGNPEITTAPANLVNGTATIAIPANTLPLGPVGIAGNYSGDAYYLPAFGLTTVTVNSSGTISPAVTVTPPSGILQTYPFSIVVTLKGPNGSPTPTGSISLLNHNYAVNPQPLVNGSATFVIQGGMEGGTNTFTATYLGDANYTSGSGTGIVTFIATPGLNFSSNLPTISADQPFSQTITVVPLIMFPGDSVNVPTATGTMTLSTGTYTSSPVALIQGAASFTIPSNTMSVGNDTVTASYSGDANYLPGVRAETVIVTAPVPPGLTLTGTSVSLVPGATSGNASTITLTPAGGFTGSVAMTASVTSSPAGAQYPPTLSFGGTTPVNISGSAAATATLTIATTAPSTADLSRPARPDQRWYSAGGMALACLLLFGIPARRRTWRNLLRLSALFLFLAGSVMACGGGGGGGGGSKIAGTTPGTYTITVTGTSGPVSATGTVTLTVQ